MSEFRYFALSDFECSETGKNKIQPLFVHKLDDLRDSCGFPFRINSGYRSPEHSIEAAKPGGGGQHTTGFCADIAIANGAQRFTILKNAMAHGWTGIGIAKTFVHLDMRTTTPVVWTY
jgi:uncharacterized protein YcbK (DUF882 family)